MGTSRGNGKYIETPERLRELFEQYKVHRKANGKEKHYFSPAAGAVVSAPVELPLTWISFEVWLRKHNIIRDLEDYEKNDDGRYQDYAPVIREIKAEIYDDKYSGAAAQLFQHNIIARDLGLMERTDHTSKGEKVEFPTEIRIVRVNPKE